MKKKILLTLLTLIAALMLSTTAVFAAQLTDGTYYIKQGDKSVNVYIEHLSEAKNNTKVNMYTSNDSSANQKFVFTNQEDGTYLITVADRQKLTLNVKAVKKDTSIITYSKGSSSNKYFLVEEAKESGYYTLRMKDDPSLALTATGDKGLTLREFTGNANQQFYIHKEGTKAPALTKPVYEFADALLEDGTYYIKQGNTSINVDIDEISSAKNNTVINMISSNNLSDSQKFKLTRQDDGSFLITVSKRSNLSLNVKELKKNTTIVTYKESSSYNKYCLIEEATTAGFFTIRMQDDPSLALTAAGDNGLTLAKFTGDANQQFYFQAEGDKAPVSTTPSDSTYNIKLDVPKLSTQDSRWKNYKYSGKATIKKYGCLLVSATAALSCVDDKNYRPDTLSKKFKFSDGNMSWSSKWGKTRFKSNVKYSLKTVCKQLEEGKPVLIHGYSKTYGHHWAVITGVKGDGTKRSQFTVMDPSFSKVKTLDQFLKKFPNSKKLVTIKS